MVDIQDFDLNWFFVTLERLLLCNVCMTKGFTEEAFVLQIKVSKNQNDYIRFFGQFCLGLLSSSRW